MVGYDVPMLAEEASTAKRCAPERLAKNPVLAPDCWCRCRAEYGRTFADPRGSRDAVDRLSLLRVRERRARPRGRRAPRSARPSGGNVRVTAQMVLQALPLPRLPAAPRPVSAPPRPTRREAFGYGRKGALSRRRMCRSVTGHGHTAAAGLFFSGRRARPRGAPLANLLQRDLEGGR